MYPWELTDEVDCGYQKWRVALQLPPEHFLLALQLNQNGSGMFRLPRRHLRDHSLVADPNAVLLIIVPIQLDPKRFHHGTPARVMGRFGVRKDSVKIEQQSVPAQFGNRMLLTISSKVRWTLLHSLRVAIKTT